MMRHPLHMLEVARKRFDLPLKTIGEHDWLIAADWLEGEGCEGLADLVRNFMDHPSYACQCQHHGFACFFMGMWEDALLDYWASKEYLQLPDRHKKELQPNHGLPEMESVTNGIGVTGMGPRRIQA